VEVLGREADVRSLDRFGNRREGVKGGPSTISRSLAAETSGMSFDASSRACVAVMFIFQLPARIGRRLLFIGWPSFLRVRR